MGVNTLSKEQLAEMSLVEIAYEILLEGKQAIEFKGLVGEIAKLLNLNEEQVKAKIAQFYTDLNVDGRFTCVSGNLWGLKNWYPVEHSIEELSIVPKVKKKKGKKVIEEEIEEGFDPIDEEEDFDDFAEEDLDLIEEDEEEIDFEEDVEDVEEIVEDVEVGFPEDEFEIEEEPIEISLEEEAEEELEELDEEDFE
ncbi:MAG: rpoE [Bacillales bacterium]|jgi:DNA-directed RNA polymerase subunit delta|nr:rpoE [Bacillales bacterium]